MSARTTYSRLGAAALAAALALFAYLVYRAGLWTIVGNVRQLGAGFGLLLVIQGARQLLRSTAWFLCIAPARRTASFPELFAIRLAGESITTLTVAGPLVGETAKAVVVSRLIPAEHSVPSILVENIVYTLSVAIVVVAGTLTLVFGFALPERARAAGVAAGAVALACIALGWVALARRWTPLSRLLDRPRRPGPVSRLLSGREEKVRRAEATVHEFFAERRGTLALVLLLELAASLPGILEAYVILELMTGRGSFAVALVVESVYRVVNSIFSFVPLRIGVDEGGAALLLGALGLGAAEGVSLAIVRKARTLVWATLGLLVLAWYSLRSRGGAGGPPAPPGD